MQKAGSTRRIASVPRPVSVDPVALTVKAAVRPFDVQKGVASALGMDRPTQKFMAKANTSFTVPAGCYAVFMSNPCAASDSNYASVVIAIQTTSGTPLSGVWSSSTVGDKVVGGGTISILSTNTPYPATTLSTKYEWACCGAGLRFTYEGAELYKSGMFRYAYDVEKAYNQGNANWVVKGPADLITFIDASPNNIRQSINKNNVVEINTFLPQSDYYTCEGSTYWSGGSTGAILGGTVGTTWFSAAPSVYGYFLNSSTSAVSFHLEAIEHWNVSAPAIQALLTDSISHPVLQGQLGSFLGSVRQNHATTPNSHHVDVMKSTQKALGSPLGHELLNTAMKAALA